MSVDINIKYAHACTCIRASNVMMSKQWLPSPTTNNASETFWNDVISRAITFNHRFSRAVLVSWKVRNGFGWWLTLVRTFQNWYRPRFNWISEDNKPPTLTISSQSLKYFSCRCWMHNSVPLHLYMLSHSWYACAFLLQWVLPPIWPLNTLQRIASTACSTTFRAFCHQCSITLCWETKKINLFASFRASFGMCMGFASCDIQWTQKGPLVA